jgi:hypothetical protein
MNTRRLETTLSFIAPLRYVSLALVALVVASCGAAGSVGSAASPASSVASLAPSPVATSTPVVGARLIAGVGGRVQVSPDGKWIALTPPQPGGKGSPPWIPTIELHDVNGKLVRSVEVPTPNWTWMPDSSGIFVWMDAPQHPATLGVLDITGIVPRSTALMMADQTLSRDGRWIVAAQAAGCCMFVTYPEIRIAPRSGGDATSLVAAKVDAKGLALLGIDAADRVVYRDADQILRVGLRGGTPQVLGSIPDFKTTMAGSTSPDGTVILVRGYEPQRWYVIANDRASLWDDSAGEIVADFQGERLLFGTAARWIGPHTLLVRAPSGELSSFDALRGLPTVTKASMRADDIVLAHDRGRLLVARGKSSLIIDIATGFETEVPVETSSDGARASRAWALPGGGFILSTLTATYRID